MNLPALVAQVEELSQAPVLYLDEVLVSGGLHICYGSQQQLEVDQLAPVKTWAVRIGDRFMRRDGAGMTANGILSSEGDPFKVVVARARFLGKVKSTEILRALVQGRGGINEIIDSGSRLLYDGPELATKEKGIECTHRLAGQRAKEYGLDGFRANLEADNQSVTLIDRTGTFVIEASLCGDQGRVKVSFVDAESEKLRPGNEITGINGKMVALRLIRLAEHDQICNSCSVNKSGELIDACALSDNS